MTRKNGEKALLVKILDSFGKLCSAMFRVFSVSLVHELI